MLPDPRRTPYESAVEKQIREAQERGDFDGLPGRGEPLPNLHDTSEDWWIRGYLEREGISRDALLPEPVQLRKELAALPETVRGLRSEQAVRDLVRELNLRVVRELRMPSMPRVPLRKADPEAIVAGWREARRAPVPPPPARVPPGPGRSRWWHRLTRRRPARVRDG
ncbi:MAG: DUF1992 domain-containing protein [Pseudonocardia sp.]|nr:DUF1992 domain-containing protein [Pseudonocardia sp.]